MVVVMVGGGDGGDGGGGDGGDGGGVSLWLLPEVVRMVLLLEAVAVACVLVC